jgi:hypothetical protein
MSGFCDWLSWSQATTAGCVEGKEAKEAMGEQEVNHTSCARQVFRLPAFSINLSNTHTLTRTASIYQVWSLSIYLQP